ncbi:MAG: homocysteine S-methyltransferase family protein [Clostridia bacterium]|nr:homocysteine S-methyltransferase family protein [Clostridia bacterium]
MNKPASFPFALPFVLDGATGTELTKRGMPVRACTERFVLDNPEIIQTLQSEYLAAGSDAMLAPTFGANRPTLERHGFAPDSIEATCRALFRIAKDNAGNAKVGGDMSPTGLLLKPYGDTEPEKVYEIYREQASFLLDCGVDFFFIETMISASEAKLAVRAVRDLSKDIPVFVSLTVNENGRTINGDCLDAVLISLLPYDIQAFGCNCSIGPDVIFRALTPAAPVAKRYGIPLIAKPNAGMPVHDADGMHYPLSPEDMAAAVDGLIGLGVGVFGGCCGTTPAHIGAIAQAAKSSRKERFSDVEAIEEANYVSTTRTWAKVEDDAEYTAVDADSEDDLYDMTDELDPDEVMYLELGEGAADVIIRMEGFLPNPIAARGDEAEIRKVENILCRKVR